MVLPRAFAFEPFREFAFRTISQVTLNYRDMAFSDGRAGEVHGGDRLPWVRGADNYGSLSQIAWQAHVYGAANQALTDWCAAHALPLHVTAWLDDHHQAGLTRDTVYLLRPDTYVALIDKDGSAAALARYFQARGLRPD